MLYWAWTDGGFVYTYCQLTLTLNKRWTRPLVKEGAPYGQARKCQTLTHMWSWAPAGAQHRAWLTVSGNGTLTVHWQKAPLPTALLLLRASLLRLLSNCLATGVFAEPFPSNGSLLASQFCFSADMPQYCRRKSSSYKASDLGSVRFEYRPGYRQLRWRISTVFFGIPGKCCDSTSN
jgi:hypothetical protein